MNSLRCSRLALLAAALMGVACGVARAAAADRPNIVLILIDDLGGRDLGCYGSTYHRTPHLDRLAAAGMKFTDAYAACPVCSPTRASILTGRYPPRYNLTTYLPGRPDRPDQKLLQPVIERQLALGEVSLARVLKDAGYATGQLGKWHLGGRGFEPERFGFDLSIGGDAAGSPASYFAPYRNARGRLMPGLESAPEGEYLTDRLTAEAEKFIEANRGRPFFLYLPHYAVHVPLRARAELVKKYARGLPPGHQNNPIYAAMVESVDDSVGRIVATLDRLKLAERTILLFTSDNGGLSVQEGPNTPATINAPLREGKGYLYEGGIRVPLLCKWPVVVRPGSTSSVPVCSIDFFPTLLDVCGLARDVTVDGISLESMLRGGSAPPRDALYWHYPHYANQGGKPSGAVRAGDWKLLEFYEDGRRELYDLKKDVGETRNLAADRPELVAELAGKLGAWRGSVGAHMPKPNPGYVPNPQAADGTITLPARTANLHGTQVRYEPLPHKNTLGYWTRVEDWVSWDFTVRKPGAFAVEILQGCGKGQGGSEVEVAVGTHVLRAVVEDTGHFQNFKARALGTLRIDEPGRHTLNVRPRSKPGVAVMDLRAVTLKPAER